MFFYYIVRSSSIQLTAKHPKIINLQSVALLPLFIMLNLETKQFVVAKTRSKGQYKYIFYDDTFFD